MANKRKGQASNVGRIEEDEFSKYADMTPSERLAKVWELTVEEWARRGHDICGLRLDRSVVRIIRRTPREQK